MYRQLLLSSCLFLFLRGVLIFIKCFKGVTFALACLTSSKTVLGVAYVTGLSALIILRCLIWLAVDPSFVYHVILSVILKCFYDVKLMFVSFLWAITVGC